MGYIHKQATEEGCLENLQELTQGGEIFGQMHILVIPYEFCGLASDGSVHVLVTQIDALGVFYNSTRMKPFVFIQFVTVAEL